MKEVILLKNGEIALKGLNRSVFEDILIKNIKLKLSELGSFKCYKAQSTIYVEPLSDDIDISCSISKLKEVFGIVGICRTFACEKDINIICQTALEYFKTQLAFAKTFKVEAKRSDKKFHLKSPEISRIVGGYILGNLDNISVDLHNPDVVVNVEVRDFGAYIYADQIRGLGGLPTGSSGNGMLMISGGIDSPVAGYLMAKRGMKLFSTHFISPPYTSERAKLKVLDLLKRVSVFSGPIKSYIVNFTEFQETLKRVCPEEFFTIIMRRYMLKVTEKFASDCSCPVIITGESLAQVASQTLPALVCTEEASSMPILRPLIGLDKSDIITIAKQINTYNTSILPYEDCCTVFTPRHPKTRPTLEGVLKAEDSIKPFETQLLENIWKNTEVIEVF